MIRTGNLVYNQIIDKDMKRQNYQKDKKKQPKTKANILFEIKQ